MPSTASQVVEVKPIPSSSLEAVGAWRTMGHGLHHTTLVVTALLGSAGTSSSLEMGISSIDASTSVYVRAASRRAPQRMMGVQEADILLESPRSFQDATVALRGRGYKRINDPRLR